MCDLTSKSLEVAQSYASFWRLIYMSVHKYDSHPTGELLTVMTIALLHKVGYNPTISDLVELTKLKKTTVSRYVSRQMKEGFLTEVVDTKDRRRRRLHSTQLGKDDEQWNESQILELTNLNNELFSGVGEKRDSLLDFKKILLNGSEISH